MSLHATNLQVNLLSEPLGIDTPLPEFSWQLSSEQTGSSQAAYQIEVSDGSDNTICWDSGRVRSSLPFGIRYQGSPLASSRRYHWRVRVWDELDEPHGPHGPHDHNDKSERGVWCQTSWFETAFVADSVRLEAEAKWISRKALPSKKQQREDRDTLYFRHEITLPGRVRRARITASGLGWYKLYVNGTNLTGREQVPRWTPYEHFIEYQVYDATEALRHGTNLVGAVVADGHYRGENNGLGYRNCYGDRLGFLCQLTVELDDGHELRFSTDATWTVSTGRVLRSDPKAGEIVDFRIPDDFTMLASPEGTNTDIKASVTAWDAVDTLTWPTKAMIAEEAPRVDEIRQLPAVRVWRSPLAGDILVDFGQNIAGFVRAVLRGDEGTRVTLSFSEALTPEGEIDLDYVEPFGKDRPQRDEAVLSGAASGDVFEPLFTIHGFRYMAIRGLHLPSRGQRRGEDDDGHEDADLQLLQIISPSDLTAIVMSTRFSPAATAEFDCSDTRLTRLFHNTLWSFWGNFTDTATDCPTRERSGWTGDVQVFASTAVLLSGSGGGLQGFLRRYLRNLRAEQRTDDGRIPPFIPSGDSTFSGGPSLLCRVTSSSVGWGDVSVLLPWLMYRHYGDVAVLERQYDSMRLWVDGLAARARNQRSWRRRLPLWSGPADVEKYVVDTGFHWGEWLRPGETDMLNLHTNLLLWPNAAIPTAYLSHSSGVLARAAGVLGRSFTADEVSYGELASRTADAWRTSFVRESGCRIGHDKQDDYVRAVRFGLVSGENKAAALARLAELVEQASYHIGTGFLSTGELVPTLCDGGYAEHAFRVLLQTSPPSWLHAVVEHDATTVWEAWDGCSAGGKARLSQNHYALGAVVGWLFRGLVGFDIAGGSGTAGLAWREMRIRPRIGGGITHARASINIPYGRLSCAWRLMDADSVGDSDVALDVQLPPGTTADVQIKDDGATYRVVSGKHSLLWTKGSWTKVS